MQSLAAQDVGGEGVDQRFQRRCRGFDLTGQGRGLQAHPVAGEDLGLAIERQVVIMLRYDNMGEQPCSGAAAGDCVIRRPVPPPPCRRRGTTASREYAE
jgi:hypothetical protein